MVVFLIFGKNNGTVVDKVMIESLFQHINMFGIEIEQGRPGVVLMWKSIIAEACWPPEKSVI